MRKVTSSLLAAVALVALPHIAQAQRRATGGGGGSPQNEIGVDLGAAYSHYGNPCATSCGAFDAGTPVDIRWGFMASGPLSFEPRFTLNYFTGLGGHDLAFTPDLNVIYRMKNASARRGMYLTGGLGLDWTNSKLPNATTSTSATQLSLNAGVGKRIPIESNAWRLEGFFRYNFENTSKSLPSRLDIGARVGMSFWR